jgi:hypothetical protein
MPRHEDQPLEFSMDADDKVRLMSVFRDYDPIVADIWENNKEEASLTLDAIESSRETQGNWFLMLGDKYIREEDGKVDDDRIITPIEKAKDLSGKPEPRVIMTTQGPKVLRSIHFVGQDGKPDAELKPEWAEAQFERWIKAQAFNIPDRYRELSTESWHVADRVTRIKIVDDDGRIISASFIPTADGNGFIRSMRESITSSENSSSESSPAEREAIAAKRAIEDILYSVQNLPPIS